MHKNSEFPLSRWVGMTAVQLCALALTVYSLFTIFNLLHDSLWGATEIKVNSGAIRLLGCGIGLMLVFTYAMLEGIGYLKKNTKLTRPFTIGIFFCLVMFALLPSIIHIPLEKYLFSEGYKICHLKSYTNRSYTVTVYTKGIQECIDGAKEREIAI